MMLRRVWSVLGSLALFVLDKVSSFVVGAVGLILFMAGLVLVLVAVAYVSTNLANISPPSISNGATVFSAILTVVCLIWIGDGMKKELKSWLSKRFKVFQDK